MGWQQPGGHWFCCVLEHVHGSDADLGFTAGAFFVPRFGRFVLLAVLVWIFGITTKNTSINNFLRKRKHKRGPVSVVPCWESLDWK